jgi:hypothetical protein
MPSALYNAFTYKPAIHMGVHNCNPYYSGAQISKQPAIDKPCVTNIIS